MAKIALILSILSLLNFHLLHSQIYWAHTNGPVGSQEAVLMDNDSFIYALTEGFLYRSADGQNWEKSDTVYVRSASTWNNIVACIIPTDDGLKAKLRVSADYGESWKNMDLSFDTHVGAAIAVNNLGIYINKTASNLLFFSPDLGENWEEISAFTGYENRLWGIGNRLYTHSTNTFSFIENNSPDEMEFTVQNFGLNDYVRDLLVIDEHVMVAGINHIFYSHSNGAFWDWEETPELDRNNKLSGIGDTVYLFTGELLRSLDFGEHWDTLTNSEHTDFNKTIVSTTTFAGEYFASTRERGIFSWNENESSWSERYEGLGIGLVHDLSPANNKLWSTGENGVFYFDLTEQAWSDRFEEVPLPEEGITYIATQGDSYIATGTRNGTSFYLSTNGGESWLEVSPEDSSDIENEEILGIDFIGDTLYLLGFARSYYSIDFGKSWIKFLELWTITDKIIEFKGTHYIVTSNGLSVSTDKGNSWSITDPEFRPYNIYKTRDRLFALVEGENIDAIYYTSVDGQDWQIAHNGLPDYLVGIDRENTFFFKKDTAYYAFIDQKGLYFSADTCKSWDKLSDTFGTAYATTYEGTYYSGEGVFRIDNTGDTTTGFSELLFPVTQLTVYPNPTRGIIQILDKSRAKGKRKVSICNLRGTEVYSEYYDHPLTRVDIDISHLPPGMYLIALTTSEGTSLAKTVLSPP